MEVRSGLSIRCLSFKENDLKCPGRREREETGWGDTSPADEEKLQKTTSVDYGLEVDLRKRNSEVTRQVFWFYSGK